MKTGLIAGVFDIYHPGHVLTFIDCKKLCDKLIVIVNQGNSFDSNINPNKRKPIYSLEERCVILNSIKYIDEIYTYNNENELRLLIKKIKPDIRFLGDDYKDKPITGMDLCPNISYINRSHGYSTTSIIKKIQNEKKII